MYEMLMGYPPFSSDNYSQTYQKIINWRDHLAFPAGIHVGPSAEHLIRRLLCDAEQRLGLYGADEIKAHPFFRGVDWDNLRRERALFVPTLKSITDTSYFPTDFGPDSHKEESGEGRPTASRTSLTDQSSLLRKKDLAFVGYSFRRFETLSRSHDCI